MEAHEMDKLMSDIQDYLKNRDGAGVETDIANPEGKPVPGSFISQKSRGKIPSLLKMSSIASYAIEILTIVLITAIMLHPSHTWPKTLMLLCGVLLLGIFMITTILNFQARIQLLLKIEENTRSIAVSKIRIAEALDNIQIE